jgi:hypothetical protein
VWQHILAAVVSDEYESIALLVVPCLQMIYPDLKDRLGKEARNHALHEHALMRKMLVELDGSELGHSDGSLNTKYLGLMRRLQQVRVGRCFIACRYSKETWVHTRGSHACVAGRAQNRQVAQRMRTSKTMHASVGDNENADGRKRLLACLKVDEAGAEHMVHLLLPHG